MRDGLSGLRFISGFGQTAVEVVVIRLVVQRSARKQDLQIVRWLIESNQYPRGGCQLFLR